MSLESDLYAELVAICPRVYPDVAPTDTARPYITYIQIGGALLRPIDGQPSGRRNARMQINVWSDTRSEASEISLEIEDALCVSTTLIARPEAALLSHYDHDMNVYGSMQDFTIWK